MSRSLSEFWTRWHISLSTWLRDYLYIPLGGNRKGQGRTYANLMIVFMLGGLWHGAAWSYAVWGVYHGFGLVVERLLNDRILPDTQPIVETGLRSRLCDILRWATVFVFVTFGWLLFKMPNFTNAVDFLLCLRNYRIGPDWGLILATLSYALPVVAYHLLTLIPSWHTHNRLSSTGIFPAFEAVVYGGMLFGIFLCSGPSHAFIYFQF